MFEKLMRRCVYGSKGCKNPSYESKIMTLQGWAYLGWILDMRVIGSGSSD